MIEEKIAELEEKATQHENDAKNWVSNAVWVTGTRRWTRAVRWAREEVALARKARAEIATLRKAEEVLS